MSLSPARTCRLCWILASACAAWAIVGVAVLAVTNLPLLFEWAAKAGIAAVAVPVCLTAYTVVVFIIDPPGDA